MNLSDDFFLKSGMPLIDGTRMTVQDARQALADSKQLTLHSMQITNIIGHAHMDDDQTIDVVELGKILKVLIETQFLVDPMRRKAQLLQLGQFRPEDVRVPDYVDLELFAVFRDYDENEKGFLDIKEYADCLAKFKPLGLNENERTYIALIADIRRDGRIDYQEFMKMFPKVLWNMTHNNNLQAQFLEETNYNKPLMGNMNTGMSAAAGM